MARQDRGENCRRYPCRHGNRHSVFGVTNQKMLWSDESKIPYISIFTSNYDGIRNVIFVTCEFRDFSFEIQFWNTKIVVSSKDISISCFATSSRLGLLTIFYNIQELIMLLQNFVFFAWSSQNLLSFFGSDIDRLHYISWGNLHRLGMIIRNGMRTNQMRTYRKLWTCNSNDNNSKL